MEIYRTYEGIPDEAADCVIAIGNFDGVHRGHMKLLETVQNLAKDKGLKFGVLTFEPHPRRLFRPDDPPFRITAAPVKERRLAECGVETLFSLNFDWDFASQSPAQFIEKVLQQGVRPTHIVVGYDFAFGQLRKGTPDTLREAGYEVTVVEKVADEGDEKYSSSRIRTALRHGDINEANKLLGWEWEMEGTIVKGDQRGRELGFPTANVPLGDTMHPAYGIYATWVKLVEDGPEAPWMMAATNIGIRPMFELKVGQIEAHILDFDRDIYGKTLRVRPVQKLRGEAKFDGLDALIKQITEDCTQVREVLNG